MPSAPEPAESAESRPPKPRRLRLAGVPLRVKLVAAVLALVAFALIVISAGSVFALRDYLITRIDGQLADNAKIFTDQPSVRVCQAVVEVMPSDYLVGFNGSRCNRVIYDGTTYESGELPALPTDAGDLSRLAGQPFTMTSTDHHHRWRLLVTALPDNQFLTIGEDMADVDSAVERLVLINILVGLSVMVALAAAGVWLVRMNLRPLVEIERTAAAIAGGDLTKRVPELDPRTELGHLSVSLNTMLAQIETAFQARAESEERAVSSEERMRQFVADASHELRTPLTTIRGFAELYRQGAAPDPANVLRRIEDEAARMGLLVEDLLLLARLDRERPVRHAPVALADLISDAAAAAYAVAPDRTVEVDIAQPADQLVVIGDESRLRQVIANLVTNAVTHTPHGTPIALRLRPDGDGHAVIEVSDRGPGLTPEQADRVFERFYRVDKARTRRAPSSTRHSGAGLGLAIVAALVAAHDGTVEVETAPGEGATFRVRLPLLTPETSLTANFQPESR